MRQAASVHLKSLWVLSVLCASVVSSFQSDFTTETQRSQRLHREDHRTGTLSDKRVNLPRYPVKKRWNQATRLIDPDFIPAGCRCQRKSDPLKHIQRARSAA